MAAVYLSPILVVVPLPSGLRGLYEVQPQHVPRAGIPESLRWPVECGRQIAHTDPSGFWCKPGSWDSIDDRRTLALIERVPEFTAADVEGGRA
jgi:hypothetical protein